MNVKGSSWPIWKTNRRRILRFMIAQYNIRKHSAIFEKDFEELKEYEYAMNYIRALDDRLFYKKCPMCNSDKVTFGRARDICFDGTNDVELGKIESLMISHCENCGYSAIEDF